MTTAQDYIHKLNRNPSELPPFQWADYLELLCIANIDGELSESDVISRLSKRQKDLKEGNSEDISLDQEFDSDLDSIASNRSKISDRWETNVKNWFHILSMLSKMYKEFYPFEIHDKEMKLKTNELTNRQRLYVYLLLCSSLYLFTKKAENKLTQSFEVLCIEAFKNVIPKDAEIHLFGSNPLNQSGHFDNKLSFWERLNKLAKLLDEPLSQKISKTHYPPRHRGDEGLDIVAWIPTNDNLPSKIIFFGQCACGNDWKKKQHESSFASWSNKIELTTFTINNIFIPYCFRNSNGEWYKPGDIQKTFLMDRKRILDFCCKIAVLDYHFLPAHNIVDEIHQIKESVL